MGIYDSCPQAIVGVPANDCLLIFGYLETCFKFPSFYYELFLVSKYKGIGEDVALHKDHVGGANSGTNGTLTNLKNLDGKICIRRDGFLLCYEL